MSVSVEIVDHVTPALVKLQREFKDVRRTFRPMMELRIRAARENINTAGRRSGHPYAPRAASTMRAITSANRKRFQSVGLPLHATGRMLRGLSFGGSDSSYQESETEATFTLLVLYAGFHQTGTRRMPQRKIDDPTERDERDMVRVARKSFRERIEPLGLEWSDDGEAVF